MKSFSRQQLLNLIVIRKELLNFLSVVEKRFFGLHEY